MLDTARTKAWVCNQPQTWTLFHLDSTCSPSAQVGDWIETIIHQMPLRAINIGGIIEQADSLENVTTLHIIVNCFSGYTGLPSAMKTFRCLKKRKEKKMLLEHLTIKVNEIAFDGSVEALLTLEPSTHGNYYLPRVCLNVGGCCHASSAVC